MFHNESLSYLLQVLILVQVMNVRRQTRAKTIMESLEDSLVFHVSSFFHVTRFNKLFNEKSGKAS